MSSSSSQGSYQEDLLKQRNELIQEQQKLQKSIVRAKQVAEGYEHDLQIAQTAAALNDWTIIGRTKNLAGLFGGMLKSDEELVERIQILMKQTEEDEETATELRRQIAKLKANRSKDNQDIDDGKAALAKEEVLLREELEKRNEQLQKLKEIDEEILRLKGDNNDITEKFSPVAELIDARLSDSDFSHKLHASFNSISPQTEIRIRDLAETAHVDVPDFKNLELGKFLDMVAAKYERLSECVSEKNTLHQKLEGKLTRIHQQVSHKREQIEKLKCKLHMINEEAQMRKIQKKQELEMFRADELSPIIEITKRKDEDISCALATLISILNKHVALVMRAREQRAFRREKAVERFRRETSTLTKAADIIMRANYRLYKKIN